MWNNLYINKLKISYQFTILVICLMLFVWNNSSMQNNKYTYNKFTKLYQFGLDAQLGMPHLQWYTSKCNRALIFGFIFLGSSVECLSSHSDFSLIFSSHTSLSSLKDIYIIMTIVWYLI